VNRPLLLAACFLAGLLVRCGSAFSGAELAQLDAGDVDSNSAAGDRVTPDAADVVDAAQELAQEAATRETSTGEAAPLDALSEACTPLVAPLAHPPGCSCMGTSDPTNPCHPGDLGCVWMLGSQLCSADCFSYPIAGSRECERCAESYTCACLAPLVSDAGLSCTCIDGPAGPYLGGC
jgi:hypothetical protein